MDSRERTYLTLNFEQPDRIPIDFWSTSGFDNKLGLLSQSEREAFLDCYDVDLRYIEGPRYIGPPRRENSSDVENDIWGVPRQKITVGPTGAQESYREVVASPLADVQTVEEINSYYHWPSADWFDYSGIALQCVMIKNQGRVAVFMGDRLNRVAQLKPAMYIRGAEQIFVDMVENPELADCIFRRISQFYLDYSERIFKAAEGHLDILLTGDDFGTQMGPFVAPSLWERFLGEGFERYIGMAHSYNVRVMHHTCGSVRQVIPLMIERGLDVLQSLQPEAWAMNPDEIKAEFGHRLAFQGGISVQQTLPFGGSKEIRAQVKNCAKVLGRGGGYIFGTSHNIQADVPVANVETLMKAYHEFGQYVNS